MDSLKAARGRAGLTLVELANKAGVGVNTISQAERGIREPQAVTLCKIAKALDVDPAELMREGKVVAS